MRQDSHIIVNMFEYIGKQKAVRLPLLQRILAKVDGMKSGDTTGRERFRGNVSSHDVIASLLQLPCNVPVATPIVDDAATCWYEPGSHIENKFSPCTIP